jgi:hypothetical protein
MPQKCPPGKAGNSKSREIINVKQYINLNFQRIKVAGQSIMSTFPHPLHSPVS